MTAAIPYPEEVKWVGQVKASTLMVIAAECVTFTRLKQLHVHRLVKGCTGCGVDRQGHIILLWGRR